MINSVSIKKIENPEGYARFQSVYNGKLIGDVTLKIQRNINGNEFDLKFNFNDGQLSYAELTSESLVKIEQATNFEERILEYKKIDYCIRELYKSLIFACEYAFYVYKKESKSSDSICICIDTFTVNFSGTTIAGNLFTTIHGVWDILGFVPMNSIGIKITEKRDECILPHEVQTKYIGYFPEIDEDLTHHLFEYDKVKYEKGRNFQWL